MCATNIITNINCFKIIYTTFYELLHLVTISSPPGSPRSRWGGDFFEINIGFLPRVFGERRLTYICYTFALLKYTRFRSLIQILQFFVCVCLKDSTYRLEYIYVQKGERFFQNFIYMLRSWFLSFLNIFIACLI